MPVTSESSARICCGPVRYQPSADFFNSATPPAIVETFSSSIWSASTAKTLGFSSVSPIGFSAST